MGHSKEVQRILRAWLEENKKNPYPSPEAKQQLMERTGLTKQQLENYLVNARQRFLHPRKRRGPNPNYSRFPAETTRILCDWIISHADSPFPTQQELEWLADQTGLSIKQLRNWYNQRPQAPPH